VPADARCLGGTDRAGAHYLLAMPAAWSGVLVLHAHGGPTLGPPLKVRAEEDLTRWSITVRAGHAWAGSTFRQGGVEVRAAAEDTERLRQIFVRHVAQPRRTVLHGQSWGASVAAIGAEMYTAATTGGAAPYDAVLLTSGVLGGGTRSYDFRLDLRVIYQHLCGNHPRSDEPAYPLWQGLPPGSPLTRAQLAARANECLGLDRPAAQRSAEQARRLKVVVDTLQLPEGSIQGHLAWATWHFQDIAQHRSGGGNVFGNIGARYRGSGDDEALNAAVQRYAADPAAVGRFAADTDPQGRIPVPVLSAHGIRDAVAFVELQSAFRETMQRAGRGDGLVQVFTDDQAHSYWSDPIYPALLQALLDWAERGERPTPQSVALRCQTAEARFGPGCRVQPDYRSAPLDTRVTPRQRP
jgi:alpha-beta hydrolase superfamily lysophospholipase